MNKRLFGDLARASLNKLVAFHSKLRKVVDVSGKTLSLIAGGVLVWLMVAVIVFIIQRGIIIRFFPDVRPFRFVDEYGGYVLVVLTYLGLSYTLTSGGHIRVELLTRHFSTRLKAYAELFVNLLVFGVSLFLLITAVWAMKRYVEEGMRSQVTATPTWVPYIFLFVGLFVFALTLAVSIVDNVKQVKAQKLAKGFKHGN